MALSHKSTNADARLAVVSQAVIRAANELGMTHATLAATLGVSAASVSRMAANEYILSGKPYELALHLVRIFRSLDALTAGEQETMRGWFANFNADLGGQPREMIKEIGGLFQVLAYLDAQRARI